jgi:hypothetical protein
MPETVIFHCWLLMFGYTLFTILICTCVVYFTVNSDHTVSNNNVTWWSVTIHGDLDWWPDLLDSLIQRATILCTLLHTHTPVSTVTSSMPLFGSGFQRWTFPFFWVLEPSALPPLPASYSNSSQLNRNSPLTNLLTLKPSAPTDGLLANSSS